MTSVERARDVLRPCLSLEEITDELDQIGQHFGLTRERIRQLEKKSLEALRELT